MSNQWYDIDSWQWVDDPTYEWGFTTGPTESGVPTVTLNQIWTDENYVYAATTSGLSIFDITTESGVNIIDRFSTDGYNTVWASDTHVYMGSSVYGIEYFNKDYVTNQGIESYVSSYEVYPFLSSNNVVYIHGNGSRMLACTAAAVDVIRMDSHYITHNTNVTTAKKCFVTPNYDYYYYLVSGTSNYQIHRLNGNTSDWTTPDVMYATGSGFLSDATIIRDFCVTEHTSTAGDDNTLFMATDNGVYVYDEGTEEYLILRTTASG